MGEKSYDSLEYYAQTFKEDYKKIMSRRYGGDFPIKQSNNMVSFRLGGIYTHITFSYTKEKPLMSIEITLKDKEENEKLKTLEQTLDIKRGHTGRISGDYFLNIINNDILLEIKEFYKQSFG